MGQEFHVLRCAECNIFQVHIVKKSKKWECKRCGLKQSVVQVYGEGSGKDCRLHVQKLNALAYEKEINTATADEFHLGSTLVEQRTDDVDVKKNIGNTTKWDKYLDETAKTFQTDKSVGAKLSDMLSYSDIYSYDSVVNDEGRFDNSVNADDYIRKFENDDVHFERSERNDKEMSDCNDEVQQSVYRKNLDLFHFGETDNDDLDDILNMNL